MKANSGFTQWLLVAALLLLLLGGGLAWDLYIDHNAVDAHERERLATQARVIDENLQNQLRSASFVLDTIRRDFPALMAQKNGPALANQRLQDMKTAMPLVLSLLILDADGKGVASNSTQLIGQNFKARDYFQLARQSLDPSVLHVVPPFNTALGGFSIVVAKVMLDEQNAFAGVVLAILDTEAFNTLMLSVRYAPDMWTAIAHGDGAFFTMLPARDKLRGMNLAKPGSFFTRHIESGLPVTVMTGVVYATGEERMMASRTIQPANLYMDKSLVLAVSRDVPSIFAGWRRAASIKAGLFLGLGLLAALGLFLYQQRQRANYRLAVIRESDRARQQKDDMRFRAMVETSTDWIWEVDSAGRYTYASPRVTEMLGYTPDEVLGRTPFEFMSITEAARVGALFARISAARQPFSLLRNTCLHKDGHVVTLETSGTPLFSPEGYLIGYQGIDRDITARVLLTEELEQSEERFRRLFDLSPDPAWIIDGHHFVDCNQAAIDMLGYPDKQALLNTHPSVLSPEYQPDGEKSFGKAEDEMVAAERRGSNRFEWVHKRADGSEFFAEVTLSVITLQDSPVIYCAWRDISARKQTEVELEAHHHHLEELVQERTAELVKARDAAEVASRAKSAFLTNMSHEFRTPLHGMLGMANLVRQAGVTDKQAERLDTLNDLGKQLLEMINSMLSLSRLDAGSVVLAPRAFLLPDLLREISDEIADKVRAKGLEIHSFSGGVPPALCGDLTLLKQAVLGYLSNAVKFTERGVIDLTVSLQEDMGDSCLLRFEVRDTGIGMTEEAQRRVFNVFEQADNSCTRPFGGAGLGLVLTQRIALLMGGKVGATSVPGQGSTFWFTARLGKGPAT